jgi:hypothetical protein
VGAFLIHGLTPGPLIFQEAPDVIYGVYAGLITANMLLLVIAGLLLGLFTRVASLRVTIIFPVMLILCAVGSYAFNQSVFDVGVTFAFGLIGYTLNKLDFPRTTFLIGFILGPLLEDNFRRAMVISDGNIGILFDSPLSIGLWAFAFISVSTILFSRYRQKKKNKAAAKVFEEAAVRESEPILGKIISFPYFYPQIIGSLGVFALFAAGYLFIFPANIEDPAGFGVSALLYPSGLLVMGAGACLLLAMFQIWKRNDFGISRVRLSTVSRVGVYIAGMALYLAGLEYLGFLLSSILAILGFCWLLGERRPKMVLPLAVLAPVAINFLFEKALKVQLPSMPFLQ